MKTLLSVNNYHYRRGGAEAVFLDHNDLFRDLGWNVVPFSMEHPENEPTKWDEYFVDEIEFGRRYSLPRKALNAFKITHSFEASRKMQKLVDQIQPQVSHLHNIYHHISPSVLFTLKKNGIPSVLTLHDLKIACPAYKMLTHDGVCERCKGGNLVNVVKHRCVKDSRVTSSVIFMETMVQRLIGSYSSNVDVFVVPSRFYLEKFVEWGWDRDRFQHIPNFVDVDRFQYCDEIGEGFVFAGRLGPEKGLRTLVDAAAQAGVKLKIVGTGPLEEELKAIAESHGADITFYGYRSGEELQKLIKSSKALVLPSEWYENAPISLLEAYSLGRPVIGADIGGIPELIRPGQTGEIFESGNTEGLAEVLAAFNELSSDTAKTMGRAGREWVENSFTPRNYRERMLNLYKTLGN
jgi:glycosyltransferase involved in cell wall biosynthesis